MVVRTQTPRIRQIRRTNLELIFSDHNAYCLPPCQNKCPSHIDIPGFLKANAEGDFVESARIFKRTIPFPSILGRVCPGALRGALPARRGGRGHRHPRHPPLRRRPGPQGPGEGRPGTGPLRGPAALGQARGGHRLRPRRRLGRLLPRHRRPRGDDLRARPGTRRHAPLRHPAVPPAQGRGAGARVPGPDRPRRDLHLQRRAGPRLHHRRSAEPGLRRGHSGHRLLRHEQAGRARRGRQGRARRPRIPEDRHAGQALPGLQGHARRGHRRRLHLDGLHAHLGPPGRAGGHARLSARHEGHARRE